MRLSKRLGILGLRLAAVGAGAVLLIALPEMPADDILRYKNAIVVLVSLIIMGKMLYDTLFFERYQG